MRKRWWPRSIRWQMLASLLLLELLSVGLFALLLVRQQITEVGGRAHKRLEYEAKSLSLQIGEALTQQRPDEAVLAVNNMGDAPTVGIAKMSDPAGKILFISKEGVGQTTLEPAEFAEIPRIRHDAVNCVTLPGNNWECAYPVEVAGALHGYAWVTYDKHWMYDQLDSLLRSTMIFGIIWMIASAVLVLSIGREIARPLALLHNGATALMTAPEGSSGFPLPVIVRNEIGDLIDTFNRMVASLDEQRAGLNDTLSLLDSMLANAPIGLAFVDRNGRLVRVNQVFADLTGFAVSHHLGRTLTELLPAHFSREMNRAVQRVFTSEEPVRNLELTGEGGNSAYSRTWLVSAYPVRTTPNQVRWVGIITLDASDRKRSEEALRRTEKLAVTGRLAASIAHEINNPLEAITNLLFLLHSSSDLPEAAQQYVAMAENEVRRISEITQQTLRFYRQPSQPARATLAELLDSVITLYHSRIHSLDLHVERDYDANLSLFCFAGEIRQVFANLVGNAIDASANGGRIVIRARRSHDWKNPALAGVRFAFADNGAGMEPDVRQHIFEAFFTTKEATGTGLGLWVSHEIVLKHHGLVRVRSRCANSASPSAVSGTVFEVFIPDNTGLAAINSAPENKTAAGK